jgi:hypothetical protein
MKNILQIDPNWNHLFERQLLVDGMYMTMMDKVGEEGEEQQQG